MYMYVCAHSYTCIHVRDFVDRFGQCIMIVFLLLFYSSLLLLDLILTYAEMAKIREGISDGRKEREEKRRIARNKVGSRV